jgi:amino acid adenylation domain-containing protein/non-ribosomal peptide synthase protein (TIGR01720 family)
MLFHHLTDQRAGVDIEQVVLHVPEALDPARLEAAWQWLIDRHDILRSRFVWEGVEEPCQQVMGDVRVPFVYEDARSLTTVEQGERLRSFLAADRLSGFELNCAPMSRLMVFQWQQASFSLVWTFHHALLDGRCYPVLLREAFEAYAELGDGPVLSRPEPISYRRHIEWLQRQDFAAADSFWKEQLAGFTAPTPLVVDRISVAAGVAYIQGESWDGVDQATTANLRRLSREHNLTLNSIVMGAWAILLHRYSGEEDVVFGATRACRQSMPNAEQIVGLFINTVPVRVKLCGGDSLLSVLQSVRRQWLDMRPYEHTPLPRVKACSQVPPAQPLFETLLVFEKHRLDAAMRSLGGAWTTRAVELHELTNFPITLAAYDGDELSFKIEFDRRRLDDGTVRRMLGHLRCILHGMTANPGAAVGDLILLTESERGELVREFSAAGVSPTSKYLPLDGRSTLHELFEAQVARQPEAVAVTCDGQSITYRQLNAQANRVARRLVEFGVKPDTLVGLCVDRSNDLVVAILAILKAGGAYLPIDLTYPAERLVFMLEDAQAPVLLTQTKLTDSLPPIRARVLSIDEAADRPGPLEDDLNLPVTAGPDHLAYVIYTSGTTGKPKGSLITHRNVARLFASTEHWYGFNERDVWTLFHSCAFDFSVWELWGALLFGGRLVVVPFLVSRSPEAFYDFLVQEQVTVLNQTPSAFRQLIQAEESTGQKKLDLRYVIFGGEALEMQSLRPWFERHGDQKPRLVNMYGITETTVHVTYRPLSKDDLASGSVIGVPIPDLQIYILDARRQPVPIGVMGEMYVGGAGLSRGYLRRPELNGERFVPDELTGQSGARLYKTGDLARFLPNRDIEYLGRIDDQVKIRGFRIELGEIESVLCQHPGVREARLIAREDGAGAKRLIAYLVARSSPPDVSALREHLKDQLPEYMVPAAFVFMDALPLTASGKIDRKALPVPDQRPELAECYVPPQTPTETKLAAIWSKVLRVQRVGVKDNFFDLGGDSILSIQIISLARSEGLKLTPKLLFAHQTVAELAAVASLTEASVTPAEVVAGDVPLTPIQRWFFEQNLDELLHYNQAFLFEVAVPLDRSSLEAAVRELSRQHDGLRLRFVSEPEGWRQFYSTSEESAPLTWEDLSQVSEDEQRRVIETATATTQAGLDLARGPLCRIVYFDLGPDRSGRLLIVVHHLAIDGISWRPLIEDLETAYLQVERGQAIELPSKTTSYKRWAERLREFASGSSIENEARYWKSVADPNRVVGAIRPLVRKDSSDDNTEGSARTVTVSLASDETLLLLQQIPAVYNTQVNDVLLTALSRAWQRWSGSDVLFTNLEGHGRENLFDDVDLSRSVGWFTSIFPVRLELPPAGSDWHPGEALKSVKEQLRQIPLRGIGYGILRYLNKDSGLSDVSESPMVFNYLGQLDQVLAGSKLFRFAKESSGPWHSPTQRRRYLLEVNAMVLDGRLELSWTYAQHLHSERGIQKLASEFLAALRQLIVHCQSPLAGGRTPSDFPLARLDQPALDRVVGRRRDIEDVYPLAPIQTLFLSANPASILSTHDQWHCTLEGELDISAFQRAWQATVGRHPVLRTTIHSEGVREPVQLVNRDVHLKWNLEDWRSSRGAMTAERWSSFLGIDRTQPVSLTEAPAMRFTLVRLTDATWKFLWSVPALLLDGWSWPLVFRDASRLYEASSRGLTADLEPVRPYRDYVEWLGKQSTDEARQFWKDTLAGFGEPTPLLGEAPEAEAGGLRYIEHSVKLSAGTEEALKSAVHRLQVTVNTLVQGAWALLLNRHTGHKDVVFGAAFAGRPTDLSGAESIVGPFVNNLPVRLAVDSDLTTADFFRALQQRLIQLSQFQFLPLMEIQRQSEVPWRYRLFDSLIVFQNYVVDESARRFGKQIDIADFSGPIHTNYPVLLLAEPGATLAVKLIYDRQRVATSTVDRWARDLATLLELAPVFLEKPIAQLQALLSAPVGAGMGPKRGLRTQSLNLVPPQTEMEHAIAGEWQKMFGVDQVSVEDNFFELGGHSLLLVQMHIRLREALKKEFPIVTIFEHPTVRALARHLSQADSGPVDRGERWKNRAQFQRQALAQMRTKLQRPGP